jgi:hypothetical protein
MYISAEFHQQCLLHYFNVKSKNRILYYRFDTINHGRTVQKKTTIISFTCITEINYIHKVIYSNTH